MLRRSALAIAVLAILAACSPTPTSNATANAAASGGPAPNCAFAPNQTSNDVRMNCTIAGALPNILVDPAHAGSSACSNTSFSLFGQSIAANIMVIYGENGDENADRVRLGSTISGGTHSGRLAKSAVPGCDGIFGPTVSVDTTFAGHHIALIDKSQSPACVFQSRLTLSPFNQTIGDGLVQPPHLPGSPGLPIGPATRSSVQDLIGKKLDLQLAISVSNMLQQHANTSESGFVGRSGRCAAGYQAFTGS